MTIQPESVFNIAPNIVIAGQIDCGIRATGDVTATGLSPTGGVDPPIKGSFQSVSHVTIGIMSYQDLSNSLGHFSEVSGLSNDIQNPWNTVGAVGLDGLFVPYSNSRDSGVPFLPHFEEPSSSEVATSKTLDPFNPYDSLTVAGKSHTSDDWYDDGHNISFALNYNPLDSGVSGSGGFVGESGLYPSGEGRPVDMTFEKDYFVRHKVETSGIRSVALRSPLILSGWGYDTEGNAVPASGNQPHPEATRNPNIWKTGPLDARWDDDRKVWAAGGGTSAFYLSKITNVYTPTSFSFEVDRSATRDQYTRNAPTTRRPFNSSDAIYDPEYVAYYNNSENIGQYESLDYSSVEFPYYEAFIIRSTSDEVNSSSYYNIWTEDCSDGGVIQNPVATSGSSTFGVHSGVSTNRKILIENPLRQALDAGDLCFTISTGRSKNVNTGTFSGGSVSGVASGNLVIDANGSGSVQIVSSGSGYTAGGFGLLSGCDVCANITLYFQNSSPFGLASGTVDPSTGLQTTGTCPIQIIPTDATADTESLPIHWIQQAEFKSQQVVTHAECSAGILQTCTMKIQTQGFKTCEHCGEDTAFINPY
jgi:hypothetical protein